MKTINTFDHQRLLFSFCLLGFLIFTASSSSLAITTSPSTVDLTQLLTADADANVIIDGQSSGDRLGWSVSSAGDFNGDGLDDVIVGAIFADDGIAINTGRAYIFFGQNPPNQIPLRANPDADIIINGQGGNFGISVSSAGDFNGDGLDDVIVGAPFEGTGKAYIFFGQNPVSQLELNAQTQANVIISGPGDFGSSVASAGDYNGDGMKDVIVGAPDNSNPGGGPGNAHIFFGQAPPNQLVLNAGSDANVTLNGQNAEDNFGFSVASAGDFNGDNLDDVIVGTPNDDNNGEASSGSAFIFFGSNPVGPISLSADADANVIIDGQDTQDHFGNAVSSAEDFNGDGLDDVVVGGERASLSNDFNDFQSGKAYIFFGQNPLSQLKFRADTDANLVINGNGRLYQLGISVASAGDFNKDGLDDVLIGAKGPNSAGFSKGRAHIFFGQASTTQLVLQADLDADNTYDGQNNSDQFAKSLGAGDFNGDGAPDIIVGAPEDDNNGELTSGSAFIFFSPFSGTSNNDIALNLPGTGVSVSLNDNTSSTVLHTDTATAIATADVDNNGEDDVIVSFPAGTGPDSTGGTYIARNQGALTLLDSKTAVQIAVGDFDNNGQDDLLIDFGANNLWLALDDTPPFLFIDLPTTALAAGDLDNNGQDDMILSFTGIGTFFLKNLATFDVLDATVADVLSVADVDNNGEEDAIASFPAGTGPDGTGGTYVARNQGALTQLDSKTAVQIAVGDFDDNGQDDLLLDFGVDNLWLALDDTPPFLLIDLPITALASGDLDSNGQDDMILSFTGIGTFTLKNLATFDVLDPGVALDLATGNVDGN